ncbi:MAG TPA: serine/threonine protein phosphatase, partial [Solibacterales bacterium]|nr:serine/threonine protein phosphatase [Bryobacterales bacterium]
LNPTGTVVGAFPHCVYEEETIRLEPDDMLVAYTDGITEPENAYGEEFGLDRVLDLVRRHREETSPQIIAHVMQAVEHWTAAAELPDDMTLLIARRVG